MENRPCRQGAIAQADQSVGARGGERLRRRFRQRGLAAGQGTAGRVRPPGSVHELLEGRISRGIRRVPAVTGDPSWSSALCLFYYQTGN